MLFLDISAILSYKREEEATVSYLEGREPWFTSSICLYEFVNGAMWKDGLSADVARQSIGGVRSIDLNETVALEAGRIQNELRSDGDEMAVRQLPHPTRLCCRLSIGSPALLEGGASASNWVTY